MITKFPIVLLGLCLFAMTPAQAMPDGDMAPNDKQLAELYWQGQESLKKSDWNTAGERFRRLETELRKKEPASADAAIYWQAYALLQAKRTSEAKTTLEKLKRDYPDSRWGKDADSLMRQTQAAPGSTSNPLGDDDELAEIAVTGLMNAPPERAIPILRKVLQGSHSIEVKKRALFVLSQIDEDAALAMLGDIATSSNDAELRSEAIRMLGISGDDKAIERLRAIYAASKSSEEKRSIIQAWLIADRPQLVLQSVRDETDQDLREVAIHALGAMGATTELRKLFESEKSVEDRKAILQSLGIAGDTSTLAKIAASNQPDEIRVQAIQALGIAGGDDSGKRLEGIYTSSATGALAAPKAPEALATTVQWKMSLDAQGHVTGLDLQTKTMGALRERLEPVIRAWEFDPGTINGEPAATETMLSVQISLLPSEDGESISIRFDDVRTGGYVSGNITPPRFTSSEAKKLQRSGGFARLIFEVSYDKAGKLETVVVLPSSTVEKGNLVKDAENALRKWTYEPERVAGVGVPGKLVVPICYYMGLSERDAERQGKNCNWKKPGSEATVGQGQSLALDSSVSLKTDVIGRTL